MKLQKLHDMIAKQNIQQIDKDLAAIQQTIRDNKMRLQIIVETKNSIHDSTHEQQFSNRRKAVWN